MIHKRHIHVGELSAEETDHIVDFLWQLSDALLALRPEDPETDWPPLEQTRKMLDELAER